MEVILVANKKGGVGKTTCADELAFALTRAGKRVAFANLDPQGGTVHENESTAEGVHDYQIVDTPGSMTDKDLARLCRNADWVLLPTLASMMDLRPLNDSYNIAKLNVDNPSQVGVIMNCHDPRITVDKDFEAIIKDTLGFNVVAHIPRTVAIRKAQAQKTSVADIKGDIGAAAAFDQLANLIMLRERKGVK